jgi:hypothetical protein
VRPAANFLTVNPTRRGRLCALVLLVLPVLVPSLLSQADAAPTRPAQASPAQQVQRSLYAYGDAGKGDRWTGSDGSYSVPLPDGRTLWMWGDTFFGTVNPDHSRATQGFAHNTWTVQERNGRWGPTLYDPNGLFGAPAAWAAPPDSASWYWPGDATVVGSTLQQVLFRITGAGPAFGVIGVDVATYQLPGLEPMGIAPAGGAFLPSAGSGPGGPIQWGVALTETADFVYLYGCEDFASQKHLHVARVPRGHSLTEPWEFFDGTAWTTNPLLSVRLLSDIANEMSVVATRDGFRLVAQDGGIGRDIYAYFAAAPEGPWTGKTLLHTTREDAGKFFTYNAKEHPQLARPGRIVISYNVNARSGDDLYTDVDNYRPRFVEVRLPARHG